MFCLTFNDVQTFKVQSSKFNSQRDFSQTPHPPVRPFAFRVSGQTLADSLNVVLSAKCHIRFTGPINLHFPPFIGMAARLYVAWFRMYWYLLLRQSLQWGKYSDFPLPLPVPTRPSWVLICLLVRKPNCNYEITLCVNHGTATWALLVWPQKSMRFDPPLIYSCFSHLLCSVPLCPRYSLKRILFPSLDMCRFLAKRHLLQYIITLQCFDTPLLNNGTG